MIAVFFIYGLSFFILGFAILLYPKKHSDFWLARNIWPIAAFSLLHGLNEWTDMFILIGQPFSMEYLNVLRTILLPSSFLFLLYFGTLRSSTFKSGHQWFKAFPVILPLSWLLLVVGSDQKMLMADIGARYLLAVPGIVMTSIVLWVQRDAVAQIGTGRPSVYLKMSVLGFLLYCLLSGLIVPDAGFFPASLINYSMFLDTFGVPVQVLRSFAALLIAYFMIQLLGVFELETKEALLTERNELEMTITERTNLLVETNKQLEQEIVKRIVSEDRVREEKEKIQKYLDVADVIILVINSDMTVSLVNRNGCKVLGYDEEEIVGNNWFDLFIPENDRERIKDVFKKLMAGDIEPTKYYENEIITRDGERRTIAWHNSLIIDKTGHITGTLSSGEDITERKEAEIAIRESEERYRDLFENANDAIFIVDADLNYLDVNKKAVELLGYSRDEFRQMKILDIIPPEQVPKSQKEFDKLKKKESYEKFFGRVRKKNGSWMDVEVSSSPIIKDNKLIGSRDIMRDITERLKLEEQLMQAQKMEAVGQLAGGIAHDFNNILTAIMGYGNLLQMKMDKEDPMLHNVDTILMSAKRASHLVHSLLAFSRKQTMQPKIIDANDVVRSIKNMLLSAIREDIEFVTRLSPHELTIWADSWQIEQALVNLSTNARDAMPEGGRLVMETGLRVIDREFSESHGFDKTGTYVLLSVSDNGCGMDRRTTEKIFEPFFTTKGVGKGTGLGLSMVYGIIKQHGGYIDVTSAPGKGSTFDIYLPQVPSKLEKKKEEEKIPDPRGGTETILVAEDNEETRSLISEVLTTAGYTVIEAMDGEDAVSKFLDNRERIDLMILDVIMPRIDGREVYDKIKKVTPDIKTIFLSGYTADIIKQKGLSEEGLHFFHKPISPQRLLYEIRNILDKDTSVLE